MPVFDFNEIPEAHKASGKQDTFELFTRDLLKAIGYKILVEPGRGADAGRDLVVEETRRGISGETKINWLVSCKHKSHSGKSVGVGDEEGISDRVQQHKCQGFIGVYSTLASSSLIDRLQSFKGKFESQILDRENLEALVLKAAREAKLGERYFPKSFAEWENEYPKPADIFEMETALNCQECGRDLLEHGSSGIVSFWRELDLRAEEQAAVCEIHWTCKGRCDRELEARLERKGLYSNWEELSDIKMPTFYVKWIFATMNQLREGVGYSDWAFEQLKELLIQIYPTIARHPTSKEVERTADLRRLPSFFGGLGR